MIGKETSINKFGSTVTLDTFNNRVFKHEVFGVGKRFTVPATIGGVTEIVIDPIENGPFPKGTLVAIPFNIRTFGGGPIEIDIFIGTDSDPDGTKWVLQDRNLDNPILAHTVVRLNPTINSDGIEGLQSEIFSIAGQGNAADVGGESKEEFIINMNKEARVLIRLRNTSDDLARGVISLNLFEV